MTQYGTLHPEFSCKQVSARLSDLGSHDSPSLKRTDLEPRHGLYMGRIIKNLESEDGGCPKSVAPGDVRSCFGACRSWDSPHMLRAVAKNTSALQLRSSG